MARTEIITITNMCMVYEGNKVLVQEKIDDDYSGIKDWSNDDGSRYMVLFYKTNKFEGTLSSSDEGEVHWIELEEMKKMNLADGMDKMLEVFLDENISEYFFYKENGEWKEELK